MKPFGEKWESLNENQEIYELSQEEKIQLRDLLPQINSNLILLKLNWIHRYAARVGLSYWRITHKSTKVSGDLGENILNFIEEIHQLRKDFQIPVNFIVNIDETAVYFDQLPLYSYDFKCAQHPLLKVSNMYKKRITACLGISAAGEKLNSVLVFKVKLHNDRKFSHKRELSPIHEWKCLDDTPDFQGVELFHAKSPKNPKRNEIENPVNLV